MTQHVPADEMSGNESKIAQMNHYLPKSSKMSVNPQTWLICTVSAALIGGVIASFWLAIIPSVIIGAVVFMLAAILLA
jgi:hypothetical protein